MEKLQHAAAPILICTESCFFWREFPGILFVVGHANQVGPSAVLDHSRNRSSGRKQVIACVGGDPFVPLIFSGEGVQLQRVHREVQTVDVSPTLAAFL